MDLELTATGKKIKDLSEDEKKELSRKVGRLLDRFYSNLNDSVQKVAEQAISAKLNGKVQKNLAENAFLIVNGKKMESLLKMIETTITPLVENITGQMGEIIEKYGEYASLIIQAKELLEYDDYQVFLQDQKMIEKEIQSTAKDVQDAVNDLDVKRLENIKDNSNTVIHTRLTRHKSDLENFLLGLILDEDPEQTAKRSTFVTKNNKKKVKGEYMYEATPTLTGYRPNQPQPKGRRLERTEGKERFKYEYTYPEKNGKAIKKPVSKKLPIFQFLDYVLELNYLNEVQDGKSVRDIYISLDDLKEIGMYTSIDGARRGVRKIFSILERITVDYELPKTRKKEYRSYQGSLFISLMIRDKIARLRLNGEIDWNLFTETYMTMPAYYYSLDPKDALTLTAVCSLGRLKYDQVKDGKLKVSNASLIASSGLPLDPTIRKAKEKILDELDGSIQAIMDIETDSEIELLNVKRLDPEGFTTLQNLTKGKTEVSFHNEMLDNVEHLDELKKEKIRAKQERLRKKFEKK